MKKQILLYSGDGIGPELFRSLDVFFRKFESVVTIKIIHSLDDFDSLGQHQYLLCGPLFKEIKLSKHIPMSEGGIVLSIIPTKRDHKEEHKDSVRIVGLPLTNQSTLSHTLKDVDLLHRFFRRDQKIILVHGYKEAPDSWLSILKDWSRLAFKSTGFRLEDRYIYSFIKHADYRFNKQMITSTEIESLLSAVYVSINDSLILSHRLFFLQKLTIAMPMHGHAPDIAGMGIANPYALMMGFCSLLNEMGFNEISQNIENQIERMLFERPEQITPDQKGILNTEKFMAIITEYINL